MSQEEKELLQDIENHLNNIEIIMVANVLASVFIAAVYVILILLPR